MCERHKDIVKDAISQSESKAIQAKQINSNIVEMIDEARSLFKRSGKISDAMEKVLNIRLLTSRAIEIEQELGQHINKLEDELTYWAKLNRGENPTEE